MGGLIAAAVCAAILIGAAVRGYSFGFLRTAFSMLILVVSLFMVSFLSPYVNEAVNSTAIPEMIYKTIYSNMEEQVDSLITGSAGTEAAENDAADKNSTDLLKNTELTEEEQQTLMTAGNIPQWVQESVCNGEKYAADVLIDKVSQYLSEFLVNIISYLLTLVLVYGLMQVLSTFLGIVNYIPILRGINRKLGFVLGLVQGLCILWILSLLITVFAPSGWGSAAIAAIESNMVTRSLYHTLLMIGR